MNREIAWWSALSATIALIAWGCWPRQISYRIISNGSYYRAEYHNILFLGWRKLAESTDIEQVRAAIAYERAVRGEDIDREQRVRRGVVIEQDGERREPGATDDAWVRERGRVFLEKRKAEQGW